MTASAKALLWMALVIIAGLAIFAFLQNQRAEKAETNLPYETGIVIAEKLERTVSLHVSVLSGRVVTTASDPGFWGLLPSSQKRVTPFTVDYYVNFRTVGIQNYRWNEAERTMTVEIPDVVPAKPNLDEITSVSEGPSGPIVTGAAAGRLALQLSIRAQSVANARARNPKNLAEARRHAREAVQQLVGTPLRASGLGSINVVTRFPWERSGLAFERWEESTPLLQVLEEAKRKAE